MTISTALFNLWLFYFFFKEAITHIYRDMNYLSSYLFGRNSSDITEASLRLKCCNREKEEDHGCEITLVVFTTLLKWALTLSKAGYTALISVSQPYGMCPTGQVAVRIATAYEKLQGNTNFKSLNRTVKLTQYAIFHEYCHMDLDAMRNDAGNWKLFASGPLSEQPSFCQALEAQEIYHAIELYYSALPFHCHADTLG